MKEYLLVRCEGGIREIHTDEARLTALAANSCVLCQLDKKLVTRIQYLRGLDKAIQLAKFSCKQHGDSVLFSAMVKDDFLSSHTQAVTTPTEVVNEQRQD